VRYDEKIRNARGVRGSFDQVEIFPFCKKILSIGYRLINQF